MYFSSVILGLSGHYHQKILHLPFQKIVARIEKIPKDSLWNMWIYIYMYIHNHCMRYHAEQQQMYANFFCGSAMISLFKLHSTKAAVGFKKKKSIYSFCGKLMIAEMRNQPATSPNLNKITPTLDYNSGRWTEEESVYSHNFCHYNIDPFRLQQATCHLQIWIFPFLLRHWFKNHDLRSLS